MEKIDHTWDCHYHLENDCDGGVDCKRCAQPTKKQCKNCLCSECIEGKCQD